MTSETLYFDSPVIPPQTTNITHWGILGGVLVPIKNAIINTDVTKGEWYTWIEGVPMKLTLEKFEVIND